MDTHLSQMTFFDLLKILICKLIGIPKTLTDGFTIVCQCSVFVVEIVKPLEALVTIAVCFISNFDFSNYPICRK